MSRLEAIGIDRSSRFAGSDCTIDRTAIVLDRASFIVASLMVVSGMERTDYRQLTIVHAPDEMATRVAMSPAAVEHAAVTRRTITSPAAVRHVAKLLREARPQRGGTGVDCRWNLVFSTPGAAHVLRCSLDKFGAHALIDEQPYSLDGETLVKALAQLVATTGRSGARDVSL